MKFLLSALVASSLSMPSMARPGQETQLSPEQEQQLARDKIIVTQRTWKQIFSPYIFSGEPVFITSDSVLNAWHVLFEESIAALENRASLSIRKTLDDVLVEMQENPPALPEAINGPALRRAQIVLGTAARLAGSTWTAGPEVDALIVAQTQLVEAAEGVAMPSWLTPGHGVAGIDYRVFKPAGFYTRSDRLKRYFRALRWLQTVPFRARVDEEMAAMSIIAKAVLEEGSLPALAKIHQSLGGKAADADVRTLADLSSSNPAGETDTWRKANREDDVRMVVLSAIALPDADLFLKTTGAARPFPESLEVAAWLGSPLAMNLLRRSAGDQVMETIAAFPKVDDHGHTLYRHYLNCAATLLAAPEPDAPAFMGSLPWRRKSLNSALAGWSQLRHAWALQAKDDALWLPAGMPYPGFVEPNPAFFQSLSELILRCVREFDDLGALEFSVASLQAEAATLISPLEAEADGLRKRLEPFIKKVTAGGELTEAELSMLDEAGRIPADLCESLQPLAPVLDGMSLVHAGSRITGVHGVDSALESLREVAAGKKNNELLRHERASGNRTLRERWLELLSVCQRLESRAHRQLRGLEPTKEEARFIVDYGEILGGIMFYDGNSYHHPHDDAPRVAAVFNQPGGRCLLAGTGRPQEIRVLYPWKGKKVNCRGAILPFHETLSDQRMTDKEWLQRLDSATPPAAPAWLRPIMAPDTPPKKPVE